MKHKTKKADQFCHMIPTGLISCVIIPVSATDDVPAVSTVTDSTTETQASSIQRHPGPCGSVVECPAKAVYVLVTVLDGLGSVRGYKGHASHTVTPRSWQLHHSEGKSAPSGTRVPKMGFAKPLDGVYRMVPGVIVRADEDRIIYANCSRCK